MMPVRSGEAAAPSSKNMLLAVARGTQHAASHVTNDALMFELVCDGLRNKGHDLHFVGENELGSYLQRNELPRLVVSMAQDPENVALLQDIEEKGSCVVNSPVSVANCYRTNLVEQLRGTDVPFAYSRVLPSDRLDFEELTETLGSPFWVKRGDIHAAHPNDVRLIVDKNQCRQASQDFQVRDVDRVVVQSHLEGQVVKFYAVKDHRFFSVQDFETEEVLAAIPAGLQEAAERAAATLGLCIYGGDAVLTPTGFALIDFNPWPSFGQVRERAAPEMIDAINAQFRMVSR